MMSIKLKVSPFLFIKCEQCGLLLFNSPHSLSRHAKRHKCVLSALRLEHTKSIMEQRYKIYSDAESEDADPDPLCDACLAGDCNLCDGGSCRCPCSLELDVKRKLPS